MAKKPHTDFSAQLQQAATAAAKKPTPTPSSPPKKSSEIKASPKPRPEKVSTKKEEPTAKNYERFTVSIYQNDIQAAAVVREQLDAHGGINFPSRSMIVRMALRITAQASPAQLLKIYNKVKEEDQRLGKNKSK